MTCVKSKHGYAGKSADGSRKSTDWAEELGLSVKTLRGRYKADWSIDSILTTRPRALR